ncbi:unnamed protein product [marine sediment metagenome]|uniref:RCK C-terminal domain-containing protein n=1 Tax=marine sediment metagenome TaxID=412755 RepID=X1PQI4_9ZZZZ
MDVVLFIIVLVASFIIVRIGAIAFQLTGLEWSLAKFQSLSCFTGTGFTTKEAELITTNTQRRRIASILMVLGNAGLITMIATAASALNPRKAVWARLSESFLPFSIPEGVMPWVNIIIIVLAVYVIYKVFTHKKLAKKITDSLRKKILRREIIKKVSFEELLMLTGGYGITRIDVREKSPFIDKSLAESDLRKKDITVLAIVRGDTTIPNPGANTKIMFGDELISFGNLENIRKGVSVIGK